MGPSKAAQEYAARNAPKKQGPSREALIKAGSDYAHRKVQELFQDSNVVRPQYEDNIPKFEISELVPGKILGRGSYCIVKEIRKFNIIGGGNDSNGFDDGDDEEAAISNKFGFESRKFIAKKYIRKGGDARYAIKYLSDEVIADPALYIAAIIDMATETKFLASIEHPNIIKLRATSTGGIYHTNYFLVLDRLYDTLEKKINKWRRKADGTTGIVGKIFDMKGKKKNKLLEERLLVAFDLASAVTYLHNLGIIHRDLKSENIAFDIRGDVKIFDFGLAKEITSGPLLQGKVYKLTGNTGTLRYMAPEVAKEEPYNESVDVYSLSILFWEIFSMTIPYFGYTVRMYEDLVVEKGYRPKINESWSKSLKDLLQCSWSANITERPSAENVAKILRGQIVELRGGDEDGLDHKTRRSTDILESIRETAVTTIE